jgi:hypothetical protein
VVGPGADLDDDAVDVVIPGRVDETVDSAVCMFSSLVLDQLDQPDRGARRKTGKSDPADAPQHTLSGQAERREHRRPETVSWSPSGRWRWPGMGLPRRTRGAQVISDRPPHHPAGEHIEDHRAIDVADPEPVRGVGDGPATARYSSRLP